MHVARATIIRAVSGAFAELLESASRSSTISRTKSLPRLQPLQLLRRAGCSFTCQAEPQSQRSSRTDSYRHFAPVQNQERHDFDGLAQRIRCVTGAFHELQKLHNPFFFFRTPQVEFVREPPASRRNIGETEFAPLVEFPLDRKLRSVDLYP
jgi:hypothetical protein